MIVGARIGIAAIVGGLVGWALIPYFISIGWLKPGEPFRKITFLIALGMIMGAAIVDVSLILFRAWQRARQVSAAKPVEQEDWKRTNTKRLVAWVVFWGIGIVVVGSQVLHQPVGYLDRSRCCSCSCSRWSTASRSASPTRIRSRRRSSSPWS